MARHYSLSPLPGSPGGIDFRKELNDQQYEAVTSPDGPALVIAGAGSGKTRTLIYRVAWLVEQGVPPGAILLLTFTNKAAGEMLQRAAELVKGGVAGLWGGTFHSFANRLLRRHADKAGYGPSFTILDSEDQRSLMAKVIKELPGIERKEKGKSRFPKAEVLLSLLSLSVNTGRRVEEVIDRDYSYLFSFSDKIAEALEGYRRAKKESDAMDFDDLLVNVVRLLREHPEVREYYARKFRYVLVDEYQDTNHIQDALVDLLVSEHRNLMVVGDDAQSIYSWRGADMKHILDFPKKYPDARVLKIETNYRSVPEILELSNAALKENRFQFDKSLSAARESSDVRPALVPTRTSSRQAQFVAQRIRESLDAGLPASEIAVLYRAHYQSLEIQLELTRQGVPFRITSGVRFFEQAHVKDVVSFLRFMLNPRDETAFARIVDKLPGVGPATRDKLWRRWAQSGEYVLPDRFSESWKGFPVPAKAKESWEQLLLTMDELLPGPEGRPSPGDMIQSVYLGVYEDYMKASFDNFEQRKLDIEELRAYSGQFEDADAFLSQLALLTNTDNDKSEDELPRVVLSTVHQAKGLEWHTVFVVWLADGMFPHQRSLVDEDRQAIEEERRLFYVAVTRARDELYLVYPMCSSQGYGDNMFLMPSRFLEEFPSSLVEEWVVN